MSEADYSSAFIQSPEFIQGMDSTPMMESTPRATYLLRATRGILAGSRNSRQVAPPEFPPSPQELMATQEKLLEEMIRQDIISSPTKDLMKTGIFYRHRFLKLSASSG